LITFCGMILIIAWSAGLDGDWLNTPPINMT